MDTMNDLAGLCARCAGGDEKRGRILEGALGVFLAYGFTRTTMDDIAKAAQLSRPALYLLYKNKADIYRAITHCIFEQVAVQSRSILAGPGTIRERLERLVEVAMVGPMQAIGASPHGEELTDMKGSLAVDLLASWRADMDATLAAAFAEDATHNGVDLEERGFTALALAQTLMDAIDGRKIRLGLGGCNLETTLPLVRVIAAALRP
jgi:AcrR family transcriptional regulator